MKKNIWIWALAVTFLAACSNNDDNTVLEQTVTEDDWIGPDGRVVIQLGSGTTAASATAAVTRVPITSENFRNATTTNPTTTVGIFALATESANWTNTNGILLDNVQGIVTDSERNAAEGADTSTGTPYKITLYGTDSDGNNGAYGSVYYYPMNVVYNYTFYGYAPHQDDANVSVTATDHTVGFTLDGSQDILYGSAAAETIGENSIYTSGSAMNSTAISGYNARYIRQLKYHNDLVNLGTVNGELKPYVPNINFTHKLVQLKFRVIAAENQSSADRTACANLSVSNIKIIDHGTTATLDYIDGTLTCEGVEGEDLTMRNVAEGTTFEDGEATASYTPESGSSYITRGYLLAKPATSYTLELDITAPTNNNPNPPAQTVTVNLSNNGGFLAGYSYNVNIGVYAMQDVQADASLTDWVEVTDAIDATIE